MLGHMATAAYYISSLDCGGACAAATCVRQAAAADGQSSTTTMTTWAAAKVKATSPIGGQNTYRVLQSVQSNLICQKCSSSGKLRLVTLYKKWAQLDKMDKIGHN